MKFTPLFAGGVFVVALFTWPSSSLLFAGPSVPGVDLIARLVACAIIAVSYSIFVAALLYAGRQFPSDWPLRRRLPAMCCLAIAGAVVAPFATLPALLLLKSVCSQSTFPCSEPEFISLVPHALHVAAEYPVAQVLLAVPAMLLLLWLSQYGFLRQAPAHS